MIIYQVVDEENNVVSEYSQRDVAIYNAEDLTVWYADHYYHVEELTFLEPEARDITRAMPLAICLQLA